LLYGTDSGMLTKVGRTVRITIMLVKGEIATR
jgi:hypothetical protein